MTMTDNANLSRLAAAALFAAMLGACTAQGSGNTHDDRMGRILVAPDKYQLYNCAQLAEQHKVTSARARELLGLMAKAGPGADGRLISTVAYRPEYLERYGELNEMRRAAAAKNCAALPGGDAVAAAAGRAPAR